MKAADPKAVGKAFTAPIVESALASYPGMFPTAPPAEGTPYGVYWPTTVPARIVTQTVDPRRRRSSATEIARVPGRPPASTRWTAADPVARAVTRDRPDGGAPTVPLGTVVGARSRRQGRQRQRRASGFAGYGRRAASTSARDAWLDAAGRHAGRRAPRCCPRRRRYEIDVHPLPNLLAVNVVIHGLLGRGVADSTSLDPQAKGLGEHLRARIVEIPRGTCCARTSP